MIPFPIASLLAFYGCFLIVCGIGAVLLIGPKAKTALASGGLSGIINLSLAWLVCDGSTWAGYAGIAVALALFGVFSWRGAKTLFRLLEMVQQNEAGINGKAIAFLIIGLMAVVSVFVLALQLISL